MDLVSILFIIYAILWPSRVKGFSQSGRPFYDFTAFNVFNIKYLSSCFMAVYISAYTISLNQSNEFSCTFQYTTRKAGPYLETADFFSSVDLMFSTFGKKCFGSQQSSVDKQ